MLTPAQAFDLEVEIVKYAVGQRRSWVPLAGRLYDFHVQKAWEMRACESFNEWLGQPEVSITRADAYAMIGAWRDLVLERGVAPQELEEVDLSKLAVVLPAIRAGKDWRDAFSDCQVLSRSDLRAVYQQRDEPLEVGSCPTCGRPMKAAA